MNSAADPAHSSVAKTIEEFEREMGTAGYSLFPAVVPPDLLAALRKDIPKRQEICRQAQVRNGLTEGMEGSAHHVVGGDDSLTLFLHSLFLHDYIEAYFGGPYILNSYGALNNLPFSENAYRHGHNFHRDVRTYAGDLRLMMNMLVMVDEFTVENGATKLVPGSHRREARPDDDYLEENSIRLLGPAGSIALFDSNVWHSAAPNHTDRPRMALTLTLTRPFVKQQMDYPRMLGADAPLDERVRQVLGYNSRVPSNYDEWYQPPEHRMYKPGQG